MGSKFIILVLYVDDILLTTNDLSILHETKDFLFSYFDMKDMGEVTYVFGIEIRRDRTKGVCYSQPISLRFLKDMDGELFSWFGTHSERG